MAAAARQLLHPACSSNRQTKFSSVASPHRRHSIAGLSVPANPLSKSCRLISVARQGAILAPRASSDDASIVPGDGEDGVLLGTLKLPQNTDVDRFETLLFQWANSLCQGANLPLPVPLKVDRVKGGARLGFTVIGDGKTETPVYIDCLVFPEDGTGTGTGPIFRAIRNGRLKEQAPPGEPRIMRSLLQALQKSAQIART